MADSLSKPLPPSAGFQMPASRDFATAEAMAAQENAETFAMNAISKATVAANTYTDTKLAALAARVASLEAAIAAKK
ncbi:hypothetical protein [Methylocystis heyeri]|uniref:Uncharacterized protein n=1 Tax=Methylocystis heyeri TaxID=391905 RepID=A0A6B8KHZ0_9HYPH|nr:hypothetical protein [Methylocystis heyeri]QGM46118.1 hypothetical protein H2LOC_010665 [Methylocystis heyeri]